MDIELDQPISHLIRSARRQRRLSQYTLARELATVSGRPTVTRDLVARWERGHQIPRLGSRQWLSVVLHVPQDQLDAAAAAARRRSRLGHAVVTHNAPTKPGPARRAQGTPALLPVFRSRVQAGILAATLLNPHRSFSLSELAVHAGGSLASVDKENRLLEQAGILTSRTEGTIRLMRAADDGPTIGALTDLIRLTYGVPQVIGEEFGCVDGVTRLVLGGQWAERFAGLNGPAPDSIQVLIAIAPDHSANRETMIAAARRSQHRLGRPVQFSIAPHDPHLDTLRIPGQREDQPVVEVAALRPSHPTVVAGLRPDGNNAIGELLDAGLLDLVNGQAADSQPFLELAAHHLDSAELLLDSSAESAFRLMAAAARLTANGLLAQQGLRAAVGAPDHVVGQAVAAQFGHQYSQIELLRQRSIELDNPTSRDSRVTTAEATTYLSTVRSLLSTARDITDKVGLFV